MSLVSLAKAHSFQLPQEKTGISSLNLTKLVEVFK